MITLKAKAKINLFFQINDKRVDGYHSIESLIVFAHDIYDTIELFESNSNSTKVIGGEFAKSLKDEKNNLIDQALTMFSNKTSYQCNLTKNIPIGAGLGGGSSDAAIIAKFLHTQQQDINANLTKLGADLPICYLQQSAFCSGIGEIIEPVTNLPALYLVLVNPRKALLTKAVFQNNRQINTAKIIDKPLDFSNDFNKIINFLEPLKNDLTSAAIESLPEIQIILDLLKSQDGCKISRMSGSGPTCFGIFTSHLLAEEAQRNISKTNSEYWVKLTQI